jgi:hypothetical protein
MRDLGLELKDGAHPGGELRVQDDDFLKLVEDCHHLPLAALGDLCRQLEQSADGLVDVGRPRCRGELEEGVPS